jgi:anti-sigma factor ChrR (cupin superfamily)
VHEGGAEAFVLEGSFADEYGRYEAGTWIRSPHGSAHEPFTEEGCILYAKIGHLPVS